MPSPVGHTLAGLAIAWLADPVQRSFVRNRPRLFLPAVCVGLAALPDADFVYPTIHRMATHSVTAAAVVALAAWALSNRLTGAWNWKFAVVCGLAYGSHVLLDLVSGDSKSPPGIQALWPFSDRWFISEWLLFRATQAKDLLYPSNIALNTLAVLQELVLLGPLVAALWFVRRRAQSATSRV